MAPRIISLVNGKGGVGKTTSAVNLAATLSTTRRKVLLVDTDPQASAAWWSQRGSGLPFDVVTEQDPAYLARLRSIPGVDLIVVDSPPRLDSMRRVRSMLASTSFDRSLVIEKKPKTIEVAV
jgi:chromosome partitioning protein